MAILAKRATRTWASIQQTPLALVVPPMAECGQHFALEIKSTGQLVAESQRVFLGAASDATRNQYGCYQIVMASRVLNMPDPHCSTQPSISLMECQRLIGHLCAKGRVQGLDREEARDLIALLDQAQCLIDQIDDAFQEAD